jgi:hypothetical protein
VSGPAPRRRTRRRRSGPASSSGGTRGCRRCSGGSTSRRSGPSRHVRALPSSFSLFLRESLTVSVAERRRRPHRLRGGAPAAGVRPPQAAGTPPGIGNSPCTSTPRCSALLCIFSNPHSVLGPAGEAQGAQPPPAQSQSQWHGQRRRAGTAVGGVGRVVPGRVGPDQADHGGGRAPGQLREAVRQGEGAARHRRRRARGPLPLLSSHLLRWVEIGWCGAAAVCTCQLRSRQSTRRRPKRCYETKTSRASIVGTTTVPYRTAPLAIRKDIYLKKMLLHCIRCN